MIFSPLFGWWANKVKSIRIPFIVSLGVFCAASALYSSLDLVNGNAKYWMLTARFFVGVSSANVVICRSYLSAATTLSERTKAVSILTLAQTLGKAEITIVTMSFTFDVHFRLYLWAFASRGFYTSWQHRLCLPQSIPHQYVYCTGLGERVSRHHQLLSLSSVCVSRQTRCSA